MFSIGICKNIKNFSKHVSICPKFLIFSNYLHTLCEKTKDKWLKDINNPKNYGCLLCSCSALQKQLIYDGSAYREISSLKIIFLIKINRDLGAIATKKHDFVDFYDFFLVGFRILRKFVTIFEILYIFSIILSHKIGSINQKELLMKKTLLFTFALVACIGSATAEIKAPQLHHDTSIIRISEDGRYAVSEIYGTLKIFDLVEGTIQEYNASDDDVYLYSVGHGNCMTSDGSIIVGNTMSQSDAAYLKDGEWHQLDVPDVERLNFPNAITPDGSRICGNVGMNDMSLEEVTMQIPAYWDRNADGNGYGKCNILPYPTKDLFGEVPQYVTAISISADGKTIIGQMVFSSGSMTIPVVYKEDDKGEWTYTLPTQSLFNPNHIEPVENPGDGPTPPNYESFMTEAELQAYNEAVNAYYNMETSDYPDFQDFMTDEEKAQYEAAYADYQVINNEWSEKWEAYSEYLQEVVDASPCFLFNNCMMSVDQKYIVSTLEMSDPNGDPWSWFPQMIYVPCYVDIETGELTKIESDMSLLASGVAKDGIILANNGQSAMPMTAYVIKDGEIQTLEAYLNAISPEYGEWITKNMSHEIAVDYDPDTWEEIFEELTYTGIPTANPDMSVIAFWNNSPWDFMESAESVIFDLKDNAGIHTINAVNNIKVVANGIVSVPEGYGSLALYDLNGRCIKTLNAPHGLIRINMAGGLYLLKATRADGSVSVVKLVCN